MNRNKKKFQSDESNNSQTYYKRNNLATNLQQQSQNIPKQSNLNYLQYQQQQYLQNINSMIASQSNGFNNTLLLRSMSSYLNPMIMMNLLNSTQNINMPILHPSSSLQTAMNNIRYNQTLINNNIKQEEEYNSNEKILPSYSTSSSSDDHLNDSISNDDIDDQTKQLNNNNNNEEDDLDENSLYTESYENIMPSKVLILFKNQNNDAAGVHQKAYI